MGSKEGSKLHEPNGRERSRTTGHEQIAMADCDLLNGFFANYEFELIYAIRRARDETTAFLDEGKAGDCSRFSSGRVGCRDIEFGFPRDGMHFLGDRSFALDLKTNHRRHECQCGSCLCRLGQPGGLRSTESQTIAGRKYSRKCNYTPTQYREWYAD
jgi:hypothetical protein